jgi:hypothetical protein
MRRVNFTYGQLDKVLRSLGFTSCLVPVDPPAQVYDHQQTGCHIMVPPFPKEAKMLEYHFATARMMLDQFGIADPEAFDAKLRKAG